MKTVVSVQTMRQSDAAAIEAGTPARELMRRAGEGIFGSYPWRGRVGIVCGSGNNAGDGYVLALYLQKAGIPCRLILLSDRFSEEGRYYYDRCAAAGVESVPFDAETDFSGDTEIVDCILGTGFHGNAEGNVAEAIRKINSSGKTVISADINSGLNGDSGLGGCCVRSDLTVSIGCLKTGLFLNSAKDVIGKNVNLDIGIPVCGEEYHLTEAGDFASVLPERRHDSHKGSYGYVAILGGCTEYSGAVKLANMSCAALRAGAGVAKLIVPASIAGSVAPYLLESTLALMPDTDGKMIFDPDTLDRVLLGQRALAVGMGWGRGTAYEAILTHILRQYAIPLVIDADGLNTLAGLEPHLLRETRCRVILTPHPKEFERISGYAAADIRSDPIGCAVRYARETGACVLLKGVCTVVTDGHEVFLCDRGCPGMATAGSGDVLSGILVGLLGSAEPNPLTVVCGAFLAGLAGEYAQKELNAVSMTSSDTVRQIGRAVTAVLQASGTNGNGNAYNPNKKG